MEWFDNLAENATGSYLYSYLHAGPYDNRIISRWESEEMDK